MKIFHKINYSAGLFVILLSFALTNTSNAQNAQDAKEIQDEVNKDQSLPSKKENKLTSAKDEKSTSNSENKQDITLTQIYDNRASKYTIKYPSDWIYDDTEKGAVVFSGKKDTITYFTTINIQTVLTNKSGGDYKSVSDVITDVKNQVLKESPQTTFVDKGSINIPMKNGGEVVGESISFIYSYQGHILQQWQVVIPRNDKLVFYTWAYTAPLEQYNTVLPIAKAMLSSWTIY